MSTQHKFRSALRTPYVRAFIAAIVCWLLVAIVPKMVLLSITPIPVDTTLHISTTPGETTLYDPDADCPPNADRDCYMTTTTTALKETITTTKGAKKGNVAVSANQELIRTDNGSPLIRFDDFVELTQGTAYPVITPNAETAIEIPALGTTLHTYTTTRTGLQYFYPFVTARRSYPYFDALTQQNTQLDFKEKKADDNYVFGAEAAPVNLVEALDNATDDAANDELNKLITRGPASEFYSKDDPDAPTGEVTLTPYYSVDRTLWIEPKSGAIVNQQENVFIFLARDQAEANRTAAAGEAPNRTLFRTSLNWDDESEKQAYDYAHGIVSTLQILEIITFIVRVLAFGFMIYALWKFTQERRRRA